MGQFIVVGLGNFGFNLAVELAELRHQVQVIDSSSEKIELIKNKVTQAVVADVRNREALIEIVRKDVDAVIVGLGDSMEASTLAVLYLKDSGVKKIIAKAMNEDHGKVLKSLGATEVIFPEKDIAIRLAKWLTYPNLIEHIPLSPEYSILEIAAPDVYIGKTLGELQLRSKYGIEVIAIKEVLSDKFHLIPGGNVKITPDSALIIIGRESDINKKKLFKVWKRQS